MTTPKDLAARMELVADESAKRMLQKLIAMRSVLGQRQYRGLPVNKAELRVRYSAIRDDAETMAEVIKQNMRSKEDGRVLVSREFLKALEDAERELPKEI